MDEIPVRYVSLQLCEACIDGIGEMCHTPGCALFLHKVDLPIWRELISDASDTSDIRTALAEAQAKLDRALAFARKAGHLPDCKVKRMDACGLCNKPLWSVAHKPDKVRFDHQFQPGPCTCGLAELGVER